ncbi:MAG: hypothetical protein ACRDVP_10805 [Acidimicrobiales bacterium]
MLERLLSAEFPGSEQLRAQARTAIVQEIDAFGPGALGGFAAAGCGLSVGTLCATALGASAFNGLVGGILGDVAYESGNCQPTLGGFASAF